MNEKRHPSANRNSLSEFKGLDMNEDKKALGVFAGLGCLTIVLNVALICAIIYFAFWAFSKFFG